MFCWTGWIFTSCAKRQTACHFPKMYFLINSAIKWASEALNAIHSRAISKKCTSA